MTALLIFGGLAALALGFYLGPVRVWRDQGREYGPVYLLSLALGGGGLVAVAWGLGQWVLP